MNINGYTRIAGVIGHPVEHTKSPAIHNSISEALSKDIAYVPFHVQPGGLADAIKGAYALNVLGLNITVPYKSDVISSLCDIDPLAEQIGAVNTLVRTESGYKGYNTDMPGLYRAMLHDQVYLTGEPVIVIGAGGVARAVCMLLATKNVSKVYLLNRTLEKAESIAVEVNAIKGAEDFIVPLEIFQYNKIPKGKYLGIQATNVGMFPKVEDAPIEDQDFYEYLHTGYDLIFNPYDTKFMQYVRAAGGRSFHGLKMLLYQGIIAYELWTGCTISEELAAQVYERLL